MNICWRRVKGPMKETKMQQGREKNRKIWPKDSLCQRKATRSLSWCTRHFPNHLVSWLTWQYMGKRLTVCITCTIERKFTSHEEGLAQNYFIKDILHGLNKMLRMLRLHKHVSNLILHVDNITYRILNIIGQEKCVFLEDWWYCNFLE